MNGELGEEIGVIGTLVQSLVPMIHRPLRCCTVPEISSKITAYNKAGGKTLNGLIRRRTAEKELFDKCPGEEELPYKLDWFNILHGMP